MIGERVCSRTKCPKQQRPKKGDEEWENESESESEERETKRNERRERKLKKELLKSVSCWNGA